MDQRPRGVWWSYKEPMAELSYDGMRRFGIAALMRAGASEADAEFLLATPLEKSIQGDHARGLEGFPATVRGALSGAISLKPWMTILHETPGTALIDGDPKAVRALLNRAAMDLAIEKARTQGIAWVSARQPAGILTAHLNQAVQAGMVGMVFTQSYPLVAPHGGFRPMLGNAPVGFGVPAGKHDPIIFDASLTQSSASGVKLAAMQGETVSEGFLLDENGEPTTDAAKFPAAGHLTHDTQLSKGTLLPMGGSHKAYGLIYIVSLLSAVLTDTESPWLGGPIAGGIPADHNKRYGSTYMALDPSAFLPKDDFLRRVDAFIDDMKASPTKAGVDEILYPGEMSQRLRRERQEGGRFLVPRSHFEALQALADELGFDHDLSAAD